MVHLGPEVCLTWAIMSVSLGAFCGWYLWHCEKFRCLRYDGTRSGRFRFIMIYLHISSILTMMVFSVGFAAVKYTEGMVTMGGFQGERIVPNPVELWAPSHKRVLCALIILLSCSWAFEIIVHLGELCRWLFLFNKVSSEEPWLESKYMYIWVVVSAIIALYMPMAAGIGCGSGMRCQRWTFVAGSLGSLIPTLCFVPMLTRFPAYIQEMERRGVDQPALLQLAKFQELNRTRLIFRLVFIVSFLSLGLGWTRRVGSYALRAFLADLLGLFGSIGYVFSSVLTLIICFPWPTNARIKSPTHTSEKYSANPTAGSNAAVYHEQIIEIGRLYPSYEPTYTLHHMPSLPAAVELAKSTQPGTGTPIGELPLLALQPNRRMAEPQEEPEEQPPLSTTSQRLVGTLRSLSLKRPPQ